MGEILALFGGVQVVIAGFFAFVGKMWLNSVHEKQRARVEVEIEAFRAETPSVPVDFINALCCTCIVPTIDVIVTHVAMLNIGKHYSSGPWMVSAKVDNPIARYIALVSIEVYPSILIHIYD